MAARLVARNSLLKMPFLLLGALAFVVLGAWGPQLGLAIDPDWAWFRWPAVIFFAAAAVYIGFGFFDDRKQVVIGPEGLLMREWSEVTIPWSAIARCTVQKQTLSGYTFRRNICIYLRDPSLYPPATRRGRLFGRGWNLGFGDITMRTAGLDRDISELMAAIKKHGAPAGVEVTGR